MKLIDQWKFIKLVLKAKWSIGTLVFKPKGGHWHGQVVGYYSTDLTPIGYCVESILEKGSVQLYPEAALDQWIFEYDQ